MRTLHAKIVGVTYENEDGSSRQSLLEQLQKGSPVYFKDCSSEKYPEAIGVFNADGGQLGHLPAEVARSIRTERVKIDSLIGEVYSVGRNDESNPLGCLIDIAYEEPERVIRYTMPNLSNSTPLDLPPVKLHTPHRDEPEVKKVPVLRIFLVICIVVALIFFGLSKVINWIMSPLNAPSPTRAASNVDNGKKGNDLLALLQEHLSCDRVQLKDNGRLVAVEYVLPFELDTDTAGEIIVNALKKLDTFDRLGELSAITFTLIDQDNTFFQSKELNVQSLGQYKTSDDLELVQK